MVRENINYASLQQLADLSKKYNKKISELVLADQANQMEMSEDELLSKMKESFVVMMTSIDEGLQKIHELKIEQCGGSKIQFDYANGKDSILGKVANLAMARAMAVSELNASMGKIVANPTAGSCGIIPACLYTVREKYNLKDDDIVKALFAGAGIGLVIANVSSIAGATGGCQAECGTAQAMASGTIVELLGGDCEQVLNAVAISIKNIEGLVCDPVAGLVECPCIKRNAHGAVSALLASDMALAGVKSIIPADEVIKAMKQVGDLMDLGLKETSLCGLAGTNIGKQLKCMWQN